MTDQLPETETAPAGWPDETGIQRVLYDPAVAWPKISIVTPSFNQGRYIEDTIRSVLLQNYPNLEYIIIDGGSTDETVEIIKKYEPWISYWVSEKDKGQSDAINKGIEKCTGEIFNWLNSDDWYMPGAFLNVATAFNNNRETQFVSGFENHVHPDAPEWVWTGTSLKSKLEETIEVCELTQPSTFFKLEAIKRVGGVPTDMHYIMDGEMWVKLLLMYGQQHFCKIEKVLVNFRFHENSKTVSNRAVDHFLYERTAIITDLQRFVGVPRKITDYYVHEIYKSPPVRELNRSWKFNERVLTKRALKLYFTRKYIMKQFLSGSRKNAFWGMQQLIKNGAIDGFLLRSFAKLFVNTKPA